MSDPTSMPGSGPVKYQPKSVVSSQRSEAEAALRSVPGVLGVGEGQDVNGAPTWTAYCRDADVASQLPGMVAQRAVVPVISGEVKAL